MCKRWNEIEGYGGIPNSKSRELAKKTGTFNRAGLSASKGDLIFASGTQDNKFTVLNSLNGEILWSYKMSHPGSAPPLILENDNKQFIIVPAFEKGGKKIYAFTRD